MSAPAQVDWFAQNAPKPAAKPPAQAPAAQQPNWFAENAPPATAGVGDQGPGAGFVGEENQAAAPFRLLEGAGKGALNTAINLGAVLTNWAMNPQQKAKADATQARLTAIPKDDTAQQIGYGGEQAAEFLAPGGLEDEAVEQAGKLGKISPWLGKFARPAARIGAGAVSTGAVEKLHGGSFGRGAAAGALGTGAGEVVKAAAPALAESALGITRSQRAFGRTPGDAALSDIKWKVVPGEISKAAGDKIGALVSELESRVAQASAAGKEVSTQPAINVVDEEMKKALKQNNRAYYDQLHAIRKQLTEDMFTGDPIPRSVPASQGLDLKRGVRNLEKSWNPDQRGVARGTVRRVSGALDKEIDRAVPGTEEINQRISSLIPVEQRADSESRGAGVLQRTAHRAAAHTGALFSSTLGGIAGYKEHGAPGAVVGGLGGLVLPEVATSPTSEMILARLFNTAGRPASRAGAGALSDFLSKNSKQ